MEGVKFFVGGGVNLLLCDSSLVGDSPLEERVGGLLWFTVKS